MKADVDISVENGSIVLRPVRDHQARAGWAESARAIAAHGDDAPVWPEFANAKDGDLQW